MKEKPEIKYSLEKLGMSEYLKDEVELIKKSGMIPGRISLEHKESYMVITEAGVFTAEVTGKFIYQTAGDADFPKVGDWAAVSVFEDEKKAVIHKVLKRKNRFSRVAAGKDKKEQVIAANIDVLFIVQGLDDNYNLRRIHRYAAMAEESGIEPVVVLNKADVCDDINVKKNEVLNGLPGVRIAVTSAVSGQGLHELKAMLKDGMTFMMAGSSGVGKSTLINILAGKEVERTAPVRENDSKGRHTTVCRHMTVLDGAGILIDTPGMREFGVWDIDAGIAETFSEINRLSSGCRYSDCTHTVENKCAVIRALEKGELPRGVYESYLKMQKEKVYLNSKKNKAAFFEQKKKEKQLGRTIRGFKKLRKQKG
ncbi:MAG: ribosome small subunit-dependent GTPase A [Candidatus Goldiibacteriota bacterium]